MYAYIYIGKNMAKNIAISDEVYKNLSKLKRKNESFSDVIKRLLKQSSLTEIAGTKTYTEAEWEKVKNAFKKQEELDHERRRALIKQMVE